MNHWFIDWLYKEADHCVSIAGKYRRTLKEDTKEKENLLSAFEGDIDEIEKWASDHECVAKELKRWALLAEDMISLGLEKQLLEYYDAKQASTATVLIPRPYNKTNWTIDTIAEKLEVLIDNTTNSETLENINDIYITITEITYAGMKEEALVYYMRMVRKFPELKLPQPD